MAARKKTRPKKKTQYVRAKKRKGSDSQSVLTRSFTIILLLLVLGGTAYGIMQGFEWIGRQLYSENPRFEMQHLEISSDGKLGEDFLRETTGLHEGMNLFEASFEEIEKKLLDVSLIESVYLERKLPHTLIVRAKERVPVAQISGRRVSRYPFLVDRFGVVLPPSRSGRTLPLIKGLDIDLNLGEPVSQSDVDIALRIIALCDSTPQIRSYVRIESLDVKYSDFIDMRLQGEIRVRMPRFALEPKLKTLASVIQIANSQGQRVKEADLTLDSPKVPVTYY